VSSSIVLPIFSMDTNATTKTGPEKTEAETETGAKAGEQASAQAKMGTSEGAKKEMSTVTGAKATLPSKRKHTTLDAASFQNKRTRKTSRQKKQGGGKRQVQSSSKRLGHIVKRIEHSGESSRHGGHSGRTGPIPQANVPQLNEKSSKCAMGAINTKNEKKESQGDECRYGVYVLANHENRKTYVGCTNDFERRRRQHCGFLVGGARATRGNNGWYFHACVTGFASRHMALSFEWYVKRYRHFDLDTQSRAAAWTCATSTRIARQMILQYADLVPEPRVQGVGQGVQDMETKTGTNSPRCMGTGTGTCTNTCPASNHVLRNSVNRRTLQLARLLFKFGGPDGKFPNLTVHFLEAPCR
jgi:predicted GIY-YIG superfamily endonuclease